MKYLEYKGISLYDKEAMEFERLSVKPEYEIFPGIYLKPCNLSDLTKAIDLEKLGAFDYAVPQSWAEANGHPRGLDQAVWLYRKDRSSIFGGPFTVRQMLEGLRSQIKTEAVQFWFEQKAMEIER